MTLSSRRARARPAFRDESVIIVARTAWVGRPVERLTTGGREAVVDDLVDALPFLALAVVLIAGLGYLRRGRGPTGRGTPAPHRRPGWRERLRVLCICVGIVLLAPTVGYGLGTALSLSPTGASRLAVAAAAVALVGVLLWRKLRLRRRIG
jgi:hypothetical protein